MKKYRITGTRLYVNTEEEKLKLEKNLETAIKATGLTKRTVLKYWMEDFKKDTHSK